MIRFLFRGLLRDRQRSLLPIIVVAIGVMLTVFMKTYLTGVLGDVIRFSANFNTGHVKVMSQAYIENIQQRPNDLALLEASKLKQNLKTDFPEIEWVDRIQFGGLIDVPDTTGETRSQGTAAGFAIDFLSPNTLEPERLSIQKSLVQGKMPSKSDEILLSDDFARKLKVGVGETVTLISSTMNGSMSISNFTLSGTVRFGADVFDKSGIIAEISGIRNALDMDDAASEILGFGQGDYNDEKAMALKKNFNKKYSNPKDEFSPFMLCLPEQNDLAQSLMLAESFAEIGIVVFIMVMSIVLWNTGLIGGLRRYGEVGVRLAIGEEKGHIYRTMLIESVLIGIAGSIVGTCIGLGISFYVHKVGIDVSSMMKNSTIMIPSIFRTQITPVAFYIGFIPGLFSTVLGTALAGIGIYKRQTAQLFKELQV